MPLSRGAWYILRAAGGIAFLRPVCAYGSFRPRRLSVHLFAFPRLAMARTGMLLLAGLLLTGLTACQQGAPSKQSAVRYQRVPPSKRYAVVDVKRYQPDQLPQVPKGARCTVETKDINRSVTGWVQSAGADGIVLVNAEEIIAKTEVPSNLNGKGYEHKPRDRVQLSVAEVSSVRVFKE